MGRLQCSRCGAFTEADSEKEGRGRIDHAIGLRKGKPCEDGKSRLIFTGKVKKEKSKSPKKDESTKTKSTE